MSAPLDSTVSQNGDDVDIATLLLVQGCNRDGDLER
jgi:hypothetical protein